VNDDNAQVNQPPTPRSGKEPPGPRRPHTGEGLPDPDKPKAGKGLPDPDKTKAGRAGSEPDKPQHGPQAGRNTAFGGYVSRARQLVQGDHVARDKYVFSLGGEPKARLTTVPEDLYGAFVDPQNWDDLRERFGKQRVVILSGEPGRGRTATAVRLLKHQQARGIYELAPTTDLDRLASSIEDLHTGPDPIGDGAGFILAVPPGGQLHSFPFRELTAALPAYDHRLVVTVGPETALADPDLFRFLIELPAAAEPMAVLRAHLLWRLDSEQLVDQLLAQPPVAELLNQYMTADTSFETIAQLASTLSWEPDGEVDPARVRGRMTGTSHDVGQWFDALPDLRTRSFAIALAALNGLPYDDVAQAAKRLYRRLDPTRQNPALLDQSARTVDDPFQGERRGRLRMLRATTRTETIAMQFLGAAPATVVEYRATNFARKVLKHVWHGYEIQDVLLQWLRELASGPSEQVTVFAGTALGVIATLAFDHTFNSVLDSCAGDEDILQREAAAMALSVAADDEPLRGVVASLVADFSVSDPPRPATAARVYGLSQGLHPGGPDPVSAVASLDRFAVTNDFDVSFAVGASLADLILADRARVTPVVYRTLLRWYHDRTRDHTAHLAFLMIAAGLVESAPADPRQAAVNWPTLLQLARDKPDLRDPLSELWHEALDAPARPFDAEDVLRMWATWAESDGGLRDTFVRLVRAIATHSPRTRATLARLARDWVDEESLEPSLRTCAAMSAVLRV
jgi:hypothetical protein